MNKKINPNPAKQSINETRADASIPPSSAYSDENVINDLVSFNREFDRLADTSLQAGLALMMLWKRARAQLSRQDYDSFVVRNKHAYSQVMRQLQDDKSKRLSDLKEQEFLPKCWTKRHECHENLMKPATYAAAKERGIIPNGTMEQLKELRREFGDLLPNKQPAAEAKAVEEVLDSPADDSGDSTVVEEAFPAPASPVNGKPTVVASPARRVNGNDHAPSHPC